MKHRAPDFAELEKKKAFLEDACSKLTPDEMAIYDKLITKYRNRTNLASHLREQIAVIEARRKSNEREQKRKLIIFVALAIATAAAQILEHRDGQLRLGSNTEQGAFTFLILAGFMYYLWLSLISKMSDQNMALNISTTSLAISLAETAYTDCGIWDFATAEEYRKLSESNPLSTEELHVVEKFHVQLGLCTLASIGHRIPLIWR